MTVSNQIIETLEYLFEKFGIAVDWSTETVLPAVQALMERYAKYQIVRSCIWIAICLLILLVIALIYKRAFADYRNLEKAKSTPFWYVGYDDKWRMSETFETITYFAAGFGIVAIIGIICYVINITSWVCIPEIEFTKAVSNLIKFM